VVRSGDNVAVTWYVAPGDGESVDALGAMSMASGLGDSAGPRAPTWRARLEEEGLGLRCGCKLSVMNSCC
jgi:hypothetical protein